MNATQHACVFVCVCLVCVCVLYTGVEGPGGHAAVLKVNAAFVRTADCIADAPCHCRAPCLIGGEPDTF